MTISALGVMAIYNGSGSVGPFALTDYRDASPILFKENDDLVVRVYDTADDGFPFPASYQNLSIGTQYSIVGAGGTIAGSVTLATALTSGWRLVVIRREERTQDLDFLYGGDLSLDSLEARLDKLTRLTQDLGETVERAFALDPSVASYRTTAAVPTPTANRFWKFNSDLQIEFSEISTLRSGVGAPSGSLGQDGDFYFDTVSQTLYGPKDGTWGSGVTIAGDQGDPGPTGATGPAGTSVLNGSGAPSNGLGSDGDFYIDTTAYSIYGPKAAGVWPAGHSLIGPSGSGTGDIIGPSSSTDNAVMRFDGLTGKAAQNSSVTISDTGTVSGALFTSTGLKIGDSDSSHYATIGIASNLTQNVTLAVSLAADRTVTLGGAFTVVGDSSISGTAYVVGGTDVPITDGGTGGSDAATAFSNLKQSATTTVTGVLTQATDTQVRAASTGTIAITPANIESASAAVALSDAATVSLDWDAGINFTLTIAGNRTLAAPSNAQPGTWRTVRVAGDGTVSRTLNYQSSYRGGETAKTDITASKEYLLSLLSISSTICILHTSQALP